MVMSLVRYELDSGTKIAPMGKLKTHNVWETFKNLSTHERAENSPKRPWSTDFGQLSQLANLCLVISIDKMLDVLGKQILICTQIL